MEKQNAIKWIIVVFLVFMLSVVFWFIYNKVYESFVPFSPIPRPIQPIQAPVPPITRIPKPIQSMPFVGV
jgi:hypothetical protein